ncbi:MAG: class I SAM-dependent methyltransferase [Candidatus Korobacteraceae bacterium]|jgi:2-polyprenyl-3-methyl-5-hydroxy-6-metoxy-1,4-benzoquinol methylase
MEEQEILSTLKAHVARYQETTSTRLGTTDLGVDPSRIEILSAEVWNASNAVGQLNPRNPGLINRAIQASKRILQRSLGWYTRPLQHFHSSVARAIEEHGRAINSFQPTIIALQEAVRSVDLATQEQQSPYAHLFRGLAPVVDLGCGGGEFLELLKHSGIDAYGVDSDPVACDVARRKHLTILQDDLFDHLRQLPERSLGGIFSARVIEYLPSNLRIDFISLCAKRLKPDGLIIIETINPESDFPFGRNSRIDPSHLRPVYPEILKSMLDSSGFRESRICVLTPRVAPVASLAEQGGALANADNGLDVFPATNGLSGAQAYAAIARRA